MSSDPIRLLTVATPWTYTGKATRLPRRHEHQPDESLTAPPNCPTDSDHLRVFATKTQSARVIPVSSEFLARLKQMRAKAQTEFLIEYKGKQVKQFRMSFRSACKRAEIPYHVVLYDIRHLFATTLLQEGGDLSAVSKLMGHSSVHMTANQYYHLLGDEKRRTIAKLPSLSLSA